MATHPNSTLTTVCGDNPVPQGGIVDAHNHLWIQPLPASEAGIPVLTCAETVGKSLLAFKSGGGSAVLDAQPGAACGRNGRILRELSQSSSVHIIACTGFHRARYYPRGADLFTLSADKAFDHFLAEVSTGLEECRQLDTPVRAGYIKIAAEATFAATPRQLVEAAAAAAVERGLLLAVHTERGADAENILAGLTALGVSPSRVMLCHMDKRPDAGLHRELAQSGALLEYDTFHQPKYQPEQTTWPLLLALLADGFAASLAIGTDMARRRQWMAEENELTLIEQHTAIGKRLQHEGLADDVVQRLQAENLLNRLQRNIENI